MGIIRDLKTVEGRVHDILVKHPQCRDNDKLLWLAYNRIWNNLDANALTSYETFKAWVLKDTTPVFESLSRARRKIQEQHPELEGAKAIRMELESEVRNLMRG
jgi:hypothetical protein